MQKSLQILFFVVLLSTIMQAQFPTSDFNLTGAGARAEGFGGAFIGIADDATAVVWNPAGLSQLERMEASIVTRYIADNVEFTHKTKPNFNSTESDKHLSLNFGSAAVPLKLGKMKLVAAVSYQRQLDFYHVSKDQEDVPNPNTPGQTQTRTETINSSGGVNTITPAIGARIFSILSLGVAANIWTGRHEGKRDILFDNIPANGFNKEVDYSGLNFAAGVLADFEGMKKGFPLKIGVSLKTPFDLESDGNITIKRLRPPISTEVRTLTETVQMPLMIGAGVSYRFGENLTVAADYELRNYADKKITVKNGNLPVTTGYISASRKDLNEIRVGAEYLVVLESGVIPLRAGFKTVPTVLSDVNPVYDTVADELVLVPNGDQVTGRGFSFGSGFISNVFALDITYSVRSYTQKNGKDIETTFSRGTIGSSVIIYF